MKKFAILLLALLLALPLAGCQKGQTDHSINVYNWGEYIDESIFDDFEAETGIHVNYKTFASNEMLYSAIKGGGLLFSPSKASNAGGVATSGLEMSQNSERLSWTCEEVDAML